MKRLGDEAIARWSLPPLPPELGEGGLGLPDITRRVRQRLASISEITEKAALELIVLDWLYRAIRANIKRGRVFELSEVLAQGYADCQGYAVAFELIGPWLGLDIGVADVVVDNAGRYVPHSCNLLRLSDGSLRLVDCWYGSRDINHRRVGVQVKEEGGWRVVDIDWAEHEKWEDIRPLPPQCVEAVAWYIRGNRYLREGISHGDQEELARAIECYSTGIRLYPGNSRLYFNRAVAYESRREAERAQQDYAEALKDEESQGRVLAREHEEVVQLIELDRLGVSLEEQEIYLLRKGFITGEELSPGDIARIRGSPVEEIERTLSRVEEGVSVSQAEV